MSSEICRDRSTLTKPTLRIGDVIPSEKIPDFLMAGGQVARKHLMADDRNVYFEYTEGRVYAIYDGRRRVAPTPVSLGWYGEHTFTVSRLP